MKLILILILLTPLFLFAQNDIELTEGSDVEICGRTVRIDGIWIDNGLIKADISVLMQKNSKPITGGYKMDDTIDIKKGCRYYIKEIYKYGLTSDNGYVVLSDTPDNSNYIGMGLRELSFNEKLKLGNEEWTITRISIDEAEALVTQKGFPDRTVILKKNDIIWKDMWAFYVSNFFPFVSDNPNGQWTIEFKKVKDYSYLNLSGPSIPGEDINPPPDILRGETELIIRKMKYYPKQKFNQEEYDATPVKYWVLKIFFYHTGIAHQMIELNFLGYKSMYEFEGYKSFETEAEVMEFAKVNGITDIVLEEK